MNIAIGEVLRHRFAFEDYKASDRRTKFWSVEEVILSDCCDNRCHFFISQ